MDGRTDDAKTISLRLRRGITKLRDCTILLVVVFFCFVFEKKILPAGNAVFTDKVISNVISVKVWDNFLKISTRKI